MKKFFKTRTKRQWWSLAFAVCDAAFLFWLTTRRETQEETISIIVGFSLAVVVFVIYVWHREKHNDTHNSRK